MCPRKIDKAVKRREILQAALRVFAEKGFKNTKMADIAQTASIGKGTIYEYFRHKDEMLVAAFESVRQSGEHLTVQILERDISPLDKLREIFRGLVRLYGDDLGQARVFFDFWVEGMQNQERPEIDFKPIYDEYRAIVNDLLHQAIRAGELRADISEHTASIFIGVLEGLFLQCLVDPGVFVLEDTVDGVLDTLLRGILKHRDR